MNYLFRVVKLKNADVLFRVLQKTGSHYFGSQSSGAPISVMHDDVELAAADIAEEFHNLEIRHQAKAFHDARMNVFARECYDLVLFKKPNIDQSELVAQVFASADDLVSAHSDGKVISAGDISGVIMWVSALAVHAKINLAQECRISLLNSYVSENISHK